MMGRAPLGDGGLPNNGGDDLFDIYLVRIGNHGEVHSYPPECENRPSFMLINGASNQLRATIVHEFMHAIIDGYKFFKGCEFPEYRWLNEATATWAEDFISPKYDTGNSEQMYASAFLSYPELPLESREGDHEYGAYLLPFYLARSYQPELIRTIWDRGEEVPIPADEEARLRALIEKHGALFETRELALRASRNAVAQLAAVTGDPATGELLREIPEALLSRSM